MLGSGELVGFRLGGGSRRVDVQKKDIRQRLQTTLGLHFDRMKVIGNLSSRKNRRINCLLFDDINGKKMATVTNRPEVVTVKTRGDGWAKGAGSFIVQGIPGASVSDKKNLLRKMLRHVLTEMGIYDMEKINLDASTIRGLQFIENESWMSVTIYTVNGGASDHHIWLLPLLSESSLDKAFFNADAAFVYPHQLSLQLGFPDYGSYNSRIVVLSCGMLMGLGDRCLLKLDPKLSEARKLPDGSRYLPEADEWDEAEAAKMPEQVIYFQAYHHYFDSTVRIVCFSEKKDRAIKKIHRGIGFYDWIV